MSIKGKILLAVSAFTLSYYVSTVTGQAQTEPVKKTIWNFDADSKLPADWKVAATDPGGQLAEWAVKSADSAPSSPNTLSLVKVNDMSRGVFNLCWTDKIDFLDGALEVKIRGDTGKIDQGGGPIWRVQDQNNYYVARYNPLESNFRLYHVKHGKRTQLGDASNIAIKTGEWFTIRIEHRGNRIKATLNGEHLLEAEDDTIAGAGGVGVWTKADAATSFDDIIMETW